MTDTIPLTRCPAEQGTAGEEQVQLLLDGGARSWRPAGLVWLLAVLPELLRERGVHEALVERVLTYNPARAFAFAEVSKAASP